MSMFLRQRLTIPRHESVFLKSLAASSTCLIKTSMYGTPWKTSFKLFTICPSNCHNKAELIGSWKRRKLYTWLSGGDDSTNSTRKRPRPFAIRSTSSGRGAGSWVNKSSIATTGCHNQRMLFVVRVVMDKTRRFDDGILCELGTDW